MKNFNSYILISFLALFFSCKNGVTITINNKSGKELKNLSIDTGFLTTEVKQLKIADSKRLFIDFDKNNNNGDGIMKLKIKEIRDTVYEFGYFSGRIPLTENIEISIKKDTIEFKEL